MANTIEQSSVTSRRHDEHDFDLKEWSLKARISRENTNSRRFSASNLKSFREYEKSFRSNISISSTASSPGYTIREEIDPATYSFTTALKALQAKTVYTWEYMSPDGLTLHSKWNDAERYICNPLSGEVPLECLSAKTLSGRSFRSLTSRITMSAPLIYPSQFHQFRAKTTINEHDDQVEMTIPAMKKGATRDMGTQSATLELSSSSPSPAPTPSIEERSTKLNVTEGSDSPVFSEILKSEKEMEVKVTGEEEYTKGDGVGERKKVREHKKVCKCQGGCLSLRGLWMRRRQRNNKHKQEIPN